jgi:hypothetical protein
LGISTCVVRVDPTQQPEKGNELHSQCFHRFHGATAVAREVCSVLRREIEYLFATLPSHDAIGQSETK